jgi:hypothetical protein
MHKIRHVDTIFLLGGRYLILLSSGKYLVLLLIQIRSIRYNDWHET